MPQLTKSGKKIRRKKEVRKKREKLLWLLDRWLYLNVCVTKVGVSVQAWGQSPYASCSFWVCSDKLESVSDKKPAMAHTEDTNTPTSAAYGIWGQHQSKIELPSDCCCLYGNNCGPLLFDNTHKWAASLCQSAPFLQKIVLTGLKWTWKDWPWWTARCLAPYQSSVEVPFYPPKVFVLFYLKSPSAPIKISPEVSSCKNPQSWREEAECGAVVEALSSGFTCFLWSWGSLTPQGCLCLSEGSLEAIALNIFYKLGGEGGSE